VKFLPTLLLLAAFLPGCASPAPPLATRSILFTWDGNGGDGFRFYRNGICVAGQSQNTFQCDAATGDSFWVTATNTTGESLPSNVIKF
jgi:hypothetical protein